MSRTKSGKNWERASYALDAETKSKIKEIAGFEGISQSELIDLLVNNWDAGINPANKLIILMADRKKLNNQLEGIDKQIEEITKQIKIFEEWRKRKSQNKTQAIDVIKRVILEKDFEKAERISKVWQRVTGIPAIELIAEASEQINKLGI